MTVIYKKDTGRLTVAEAKRLIIEAMPDDEPGYVAFSGTVDAGGNEHWDIVDNPKHQTYRETVQCRLNNSFLDLCRESGFEPHLSIDPSTKGYRLREVDDRLYMVTHAQFVKLAEAFSLTVVVGYEPAATAGPAAGASGGTKQTKASPLPLTTSDIAFCFTGLRWNEQEWKKTLGNKPKWLAACIVIPGLRGVSETRWNPVLIGAALVRAGHTKPKSVRAKFQTKSPLMPWLDEWKTYEADYFDSD